MEKAKQESRNTSEDTLESGRREALLKIGKYGAYVAPAVLALVLGNSAEACSCA